MKKRRGAAILTQLQNDVRIRVPIAKATTALITAKIIRRYLYFTTACVS